MKKYIICFYVLFLTAFIQCSDRESEQKETQTEKTDQIEKIIRTIIFQFSYSSPEKIKDRSFPESLGWVYEDKCYKTSENYDSFEYKGNLVDGKLIAFIYKKDGSQFQLPLTVKRKDDIIDDEYALKFKEFHPILMLPYSGEEIRMEVRRINKEKNENVLLFEKEIADLNKVDWENIKEVKYYRPNGGGFREWSQCHHSGGAL